MKRRVDDAVAGPRRRLSHGAVEHPTTQLLDQSGVLGEGHERGRQQQSVEAVLPPHERLDTDHAAAVEGKGRLVVQRQLVVAQRATKVVLLLEARDDAIVDLGLEDRGRAAAPLLRLGERGVGFGQ